MKLTQIFFAALLSLTLVSGAKAETAGAKTISISAYDTMKYSITKIDAHPGQKLVVELKNDGNLPKEAMGHNWILLKAGEDPTSYATAAIAAKAENYQPRSLAGKVLASIRMLGPKERASVSFSAPSAPGAYSYLCSFPAHCQAGMKGVLIVK